MSVLGFAQHFYNKYMDEDNLMATDGDEMTDEQYRTLHGLSINSGRLGLGLYRREEFAEHEANGWLAYRADGIVPFMELTHAGVKALADEWTRRHSSPVTPL